MNSGDFLIVCNLHGVHSLWQAFRPVPTHWRCVAGPMSHDDCMERVKQLWPDIRPLAHAAKER